MRALTRTECCRLLGVEPTASAAEIKTAYRDMVMVWHPDRFPPCSRLQQKALDKMQEINRANDTLKSGAFGAEPAPPRPSASPHATNSPPKPGPEPRPRSGPRPAASGFDFRHEPRRRASATPRAPDSNRCFPKWFGLACLSGGAALFNISTRGMEMLDSTCILPATLFGAVIGLAGFAYSHAVRSARVATWPTFVRGYWAGVVDSAWCLGKLAKAAGVALCVLLVVMLEDSSSKEAA